MERYAYAGEGLKASGEVKTSKLSKALKWLGWAEVAAAVVFDSALLLLLGGIKIAYDAFSKKSS